MPTDKASVGPDFTTAFERLLHALRAVPALAERTTPSTLVVGLAAHGTALSSVRTLHEVAGNVTIARRRRTIELGLRPRFFLEGDIGTRLVVVVHELLHIAEGGASLDDDHRHTQKSQRALTALAQGVANEATTILDPLLLAPLGHDGVVWLRQWRVRPCSETATRRFTDVDTFVGPVLMRTAKHQRSVWW